MGRLLIYSDKKERLYLCSNPPQHTSFIKAIVGNSILMGLIFHKRFTNGHHLLRADLRVVWRHEIGGAH